MQLQAVSSMTFLVHDWTGTCLDFALNYGLGFATSFCTGLELCGSTFQHYMTLCSTRAPQVQLSSHLHPAHALTCPLLAGTTACQLAAGRVQYCFLNNKRGLRYLTKH